MPGKGSDHHTGIRITKTFLIIILLFVLLAVYTVRNMAAFVNYGMSNTISYSINKSRVMIQDGLNALFANREVTRGNEETILHEIVDEPAPQIPDIYISSTFTQSVNSYDLPAFNQSLALLNEYRFWPTGYSANNFVVQGDIMWRSSTRSANWNHSGCGFVFGMQDDDNYHTAYLALDGYVNLQRIENGESYDLQGGYYGRVDTPQGGARFALEKLADELAVYVNDQQVVRLIDPHPGKGDLAYAIFSGTNAPEGIQCDIKNVTLWTTP